MRLERLYARLPVAVQHVVISCEGLRVHRRRYGACFSRLLREYQERTFWAPEEIAQFRDARLARFVARTVESVPYYQRLFRAIGASANDITSLADLQSLPVLERSTVQERTGEFISPDFAPSALRECKTSGSTGAGLRFLETARAHSEQWAVWWRYRDWHGILPGTRSLSFTGRPIVAPSQNKPPYWRHNCPGRQVLFSVYHLNARTARQYLEEMQKSRIEWLHGYPSVVGMLATYAIDLGIRLELQWITLGAENVLPCQTELIEHAFGKRPLAHYGMAEGVANFSTCPDGKMHVDEDYACVEFVPVGADQYQIVGTNLSNASFPLIRYQVGDLVTLDKRPCVCGRPGRVVSHVDGRMDEYVIARDGTPLGRLDHLFKEAVNISVAQIRQSVAGHMDIYLVRGPKYSIKDEHAFRQSVALFVGDKLTFGINYVDAIRRVAGGKHRLVVSTLRDGQKVEARRGFRDGSKLEE